MIRLRNRLLDERLRASIKEFEGHASELTFLSKQLEGLSGDQLEQRALRVSADFGMKYQQVMDHLGEALRAELAHAPA